MTDYADFEIESYSAPSDPLDLFSTSPTKRAFRVEDLCCSYHAPFFACRRDKTRRYSVIQGCCNHWDCPRCGTMVAAKHYGRIVAGAREISASNKLWFITVTCRGREIGKDEAKAHYLAWTSKFLDACYTRAKRAGMDWYYVQVTELQRRGHPHSHILSTFSPSDIRVGFKDDWKRGNDGLLHNHPKECLRSDWLHEQALRAGLGDQYDISAVETVEGASRYVAKYMFKDSQFRADFPPRWKRVRYSQSWPKLPERKTDAFVLLSAEDWRNLAALAGVIDAHGNEAFEQAKYFLHGHDVVINQKKERENERDQKQLRVRV